MNTSRLLPSRRQSEAVPAMRRDAIIISGSTVTKKEAPELIRIEAEKTRQAHAIGNQCGLFRVPRVLDCDDVKGEMLLERIPELIRLADLDKRAPHYKTAMQQLGRSLAVIHDNLRLPSGMQKPLPAVFDWPGTEAFIHGDFDTQNICMEKTTSRLVILDWALSPRYEGNGTYGSRYFDVAWFIEALLWPQRDYLLGDPVTPLVERFLDSYILESGRAQDLQKLSDYAYNLFTRKGVMDKRFRGDRRYPNLRSYVLHRRSRMLANRSIRRIKQKA